MAPKWFRLSFGFSVEIRQRPFVCAARLSCDHINQPVEVTGFVEKALIFLELGEQFALSRHRASFVGRRPARSRAPEMASGEQSPQRFNYGQQDTSAGMTGISAGTEL